jgi:mRNA interferase HigB
MHVIARPKLIEFASRHPDAKDWLDAWWFVAAKAHWTCLADVRRNYQGADQVDRCLVFNRGNKYRLIVRVSYALQQTQGTLLIKHFLTHAEYDKDFWKCDCT